MAIPFELDKLNQEINHLKHNLSLQNIPTENLTIALRLENKDYFYAVLGETSEKLSAADFRDKANLLYQIFQEKVDRDVIVLCQPTYAMKMLEQNQDIEPVLDDLPQMVGLKCQIISGTESEKIIKVLDKNDAVLLDHYNLNQNGLLVLATSIEKAMTAVLIVEKSAQAMVEGKILGGYKKLPDKISRAYRNAYLTSYSQMDKKLVSQTAEDIGRDIPQRELKLRQDIVDYGLRLLDENLTLGTWGNLSLRLDDKYLLITPSGMAYDRLTPYDMVRVNYHTMEHEGRLKPSVETGFHAAVYKKEKSIGGIIHTHSFNASVFAAAGQALPIVMPEAIRTLGFKTGYAPYHKAGSEELAKAVADSITDKVWSTIMGNHGLAACGKDLPDAFRRIKLMENAARYYLDMHGSRKYIS